MSTLTLSTIRQNLSKFDLAGLSIPVVVLVIMAMDQDDTGRRHVKRQAQHGGK